jgi:hypothetical protein
MDCIWEIYYHDAESHTTKASNQPIFLCVAGVADRCSWRCADGVKRLSADVVTYRDMARDSSLANEVQSNLLSMELNFKDYLFTHSEHDLDEYHKNLDLTDQHLEDALEQITLPAGLKNIHKIIDLRDVYVNSFERIITLIHQEDVLIETEVTGQGHELREQLTLIMKSSCDDLFLTEEIFFSGDESVSEIF